MVVYLESVNDPAEEPVDSIPKGRAFARIQTHSFLAHIDEFAKFGVVYQIQVQIEIEFQNQNLLMMSMFV